MKKNNGNQKIPDLEVGTNPSDESPDYTQVIFSKSDDDTDELEEVTDLTRFQALRCFEDLSIPFSGARFIGVAVNFSGAILLARKSPEYLAASGLITAHKHT